MENGGRANILDRSYRVISSCLNRWGTGIVFSAIIALAFGALFFKADDMAHTPVVIGVCTFDSARVGSTLDQFSEFCRTKGCGDIRWRYLRPGQKIAGCDFYIMTSLELSAPLARGNLGCALLAAEREAHRYSRSSVLVKAGVTALPARGARIVFGSARSAAGFLAPYRALERSGYALSEASIEFAGSYPGEERVVFGVLFGAYDAGGISLERLQALKKAGIVRDGEIDVLCEGEALPEIVIAYEPSSYTQDRRNFARHLPRVFDRVPHSLRSELSALGIAGFYAPRKSDLELIGKLDAMIPPAATAAPRGGAGDVRRDSAR
ncbi:MAG: PhnD/SsuA/transferrin family substrate-binding protein [Candidatus Krumholzibacteria bacterium]|nr:PhnD/SsuA/transferrin family substrate-binding protein [Candidatus Krumholzibacteria bacterium]